MDRLSGLERLCDKANIYLGDYLPAVRHLILERHLNSQQAFMSILNPEKKDSVYLWKDYEAFRAGYDKTLTDDCKDPLAMLLHIVVAESQFRLFEVIVKKHQNYRLKITNIAEARCTMRKYTADIEIRAAALVDDPQVNITLYEAHLQNCRYFAEETAEMVRNRFVALCGVIIEYNKAEFALPEEKVGRTIRKLENIVEKRRQDILPVAKYVQQMAEVLEGHKYGPLASGLYQKLI